MPCYTIAQCTPGEWSGACQFHSIGSGLKCFFFRQMQGPIREPKRVSDMESSEIAFSLYDKDKDGYVTSNEMKKISKKLTDDQVNKESSLKCTESMHVK